MLLTVDAGNTNIKFALHLDEQCIHTFQLVTDKKNILKKLTFALQKNFKGIEVSSVEAIIVASVVPAVNQALSLACERMFRVKPRFVDFSNTSNDALAISLKIKTDNPASLGADRIATSIGGIARYGGPLIIFNFGTATVCEVIGDDNDYLGGMIAPGITTSIKALHESAALLPAYEFKAPSKVIATSTEDALYGGIFYATMGLVEKMVQEIRATLPSYKFKVIATGWLAQFISQNTNFIDVYDHDLVAFGLYTIYANNR